MPDFMDEAKDLASEHSDLVDKGLDQAGQFAEDKTGGKFDSEIGDAEHEAEGFLGGDNQGGNNQGTDNQGN
jgi:antitoxin protein of toxin-antitoxin system